MAKIRIALLIGASAPLLDFAAIMAARHQVSLVVREVPPADLFGRIRKHGFRHTARAAWRKLAARPLAWGSRDSPIAGLPADVPLLTVPYINDAAVKARLADLQPDLVFVNGTTLIHASTLKGLPLVLNIHAGLSPYYRGSFCTEWALLNHDPFNIGCTIHRISARIDGGAIVAQERPFLQPTDSAESIHHKLLRTGASLATGVADTLTAGEELCFLGQEGIAAGCLYLARHWTPAHRRALRALLAGGGMARMLKNPVRGPLPIFTPLP